jgi:hypothetical protein
MVGREHGKLTDESARAAVDALLRAADARRAKGTVAAILLLLDWERPHASHQA